MSRKWGALESFNYLGANARDKFAWAARSDDGLITVLTAWEDQIDDDGTNVVIDYVGASDLENWTRDRRNKARIKILTEAWNRDRLFKIVLLTAREPGAVPRSTSGRRPDDALVMELTDFNPVTGEYRAVGTRKAAEERDGDAASSAGLKYEPLGAFLRTMQDSELGLTFDQIESLVGRLPKDASNRQFWSNAVGHHASRRSQWLGAGYAAFLEADRKSVRFVRSTAASTASGHRWTNDELAACVAAYRDLWLAEERGERINKAALRRSLLGGALRSRSATAYERRMQNISAVVEDLGIRAVTGYVPLRNIGGAKSRIITLINSYWARENLAEAPTSDPDQLQTRVTSALEKLDGELGPPPTGSKGGTRTTRASKQFDRDPNIIAWVLRASAGLCEACGEAAPFLKLDGSYFLEVHHVRPLAEGGPDQADNAVALCPNCHRRLHHGGDRVPYRRKLIAAVERIVDYPRLAIV
jgi:5-methylcytosine-specific restriction protein A